MYRLLKASFVTTRFEIERLRSRAAYYRCEAARAQARARLIGISIAPWREAVELQYVVPSSPKQNVQLPEAQRQTDAPPDDDE